MPILEWIGKDKNGVVAVDTFAKICLCLEHKGDGII